MEDLHTKWQHRWITSKARSQSSPIHGLGVVAVKQISKGEIVGVLGGVVVPSSEIETYWKAMGHAGIQINESFFVVPTTRKELEEIGIFNHSCDPNCGFADSITLVAIKDIKKGEELTFDYAFCESLMEEFNCNCASPNCRKRIKPTDWKNHLLQKKYGKYYSPYLRKKF